MRINKICVKKDGDWYEVDNKDGKFTDGDSINIVKVFKMVEAMSNRKHKLEELQNSTDEIIFLE